MNAKFNSVIVGLLLTTGTINQSPAMAGNNQIAYPAASDCLHGLRAVASHGRTRVAITSQGGIAVSANGVDWMPVRLRFDTFLRGVTFGNGLFVAVGGSYVDTPGVIMISRDGQMWTRRNPDHRSNLYGVAHGRGLFVAVGDHDTILISSDAVSWKRRDSRTSDILFAAVAYGAGTFVVVGDSGIIQTSADGARWTNRNSGTSEYLNQVVHGKEAFVASASGVALTSTDGTLWSRNYLAQTNPQIPDTADALTNR